MMRAPDIRLLTLPHRLPAEADALLDDAATGDVFASRLWYDTTLSHALPQQAEPLLALCGNPVSCAVPLMRRAGGSLASLATPYTLTWRPLAATGDNPDAMRAAGVAFGGYLRWRAPASLDTLDADTSWLRALSEGLGAAGIRTARYRHFVNRHQQLAPGEDWQAYLAARPPELRATIARKSARAARTLRFELLTSPGAALEAGIAAYEAVRARSWKPDEPFPAFDAALMRASAGAAILRLGILRRAEDAAPVAAQYWLRDQGGRRAMILKLAYDQESRALSPGTVLTAMMIRHLIEEDRVDELDFGRGDDPYKQAWVGQVRSRIGLVLAHPLHPAGLAALARQAAGNLRRRISG